MRLVPQRSSSSCCSEWREPWREWSCRDGRLAPGGAPRRSILIGVVGAVVGFFVVPILGLALGGTLGIYLAERLRTGNSGAAWRTTKGTLKGFGLAALAQLATGLAMAAVWVIWV